MGVNKLQGVLWIVCLEAGQLLVWTVDLFWTAAAACSWLFLFQPLKTESCDTLVSWAWAVSAALQQARSSCDSRQVLLPFRLFRINRNRRDGLFSFCNSKELLNRTERIELIIQQSYILYSKPVELQVHLAMGDCRVGTGRGMSHRSRRLTLFKVHHCCFPWTLRFSMNAWTNICLVSLQPTVWC